MPKLSISCLIVGGVIIFAGLAILSKYDVLVLRISVPQEKGDLIYQDIASSGTKLCMQYIHSVERTPVKGWFALSSDGGFQALRTMSKGSGTGLPNVADKPRVAMDNEWMVIDEQRTYVPQISFYYLPLNDLQLSVSGQKVDLSDVLPGSKLLISNEKMSLGRALFSFGLDKSGL
ncbi:MAG: DUF1850 domain-containing protein [Desulfovermiculus sp.]